MTNPFARLLERYRRNSISYFSEANLDAGFNKFWDRFKRGTFEEKNVNETDDPVLSIKLSELKRLLLLAYMQRHNDAKKECEETNAMFKQELARGGPFSDLING